MAPLKIPMQLSCPNCQQGNLPGSPYCSGCGAPLADVMPDATTAMRPVSPGLMPVSENPLQRLTTEGQDRSLVKQSYDRAFAILTSGESIDYIAVAARAGLAHAPDCVVATNKRIMLFRKKMLGKYELDDCYWRDVRSALLTDSKNGVTLTFEAIQGWHMTVDGLPKAQAWRVYELAVEHSDHVKNSARQPALPVPSAPVVPVAKTAGTPAWTTAAQPSREENPQAVLAPILPGVIAGNGQSAVPTNPAPVAMSELGPNPRSQAAAGSPAQAAGFVPTPESVLQTILQQSQAFEDSGAPTRPIQFPAAAFQAPAVADAQQVTVRDTSTDPHLRAVPQMPPMPTLEQIAVFSGPLAFNHLQPNGVSEPLNHYVVEPDVKEEQLAYEPQVAQAQSDAPVNAQADENVQNKAADEAIHAPEPQVERRSKPSGKQATAQATDAHTAPDKKESDARPEVASTEAQAPQFAQHSTSAYDDASEPFNIAELLGTLANTAPNMHSGPLPMPGSLTSGPLLSANLSGPMNGTSFATQLNLDEDGLATQHLYMDRSDFMDADRPTDINLGQYPIASSRNGKSSKPATTPGTAKGGSSRASGSTPTGRSSQGKGTADDPISKMKQLKMLLDAGFITESDYEAKKADILARFF